MKIYKIIFAGLLLAIGLRYYTNAAQVKSLEEETKGETAKIESSTPEMYMLVLSNGQSLPFAKKLLEQAGFFQPMLQSNELTIPIVKYIAELHTKNPDEVSLQDLHTILSVIVNHAKEPAAALEKLFSVDKPSLRRLINLLHVANYFDIQPLYLYIINIVKQQFARHSNKAEFKALIADLPDDWQKEITSLGVTNDTFISYFLENHYLPTRILRGHTNAVTSVAYSPDGTQLVSGSWDRTARLWNIETGAQIRTLESPEGRSVNSVAWSPDGRYIAAGFDNGIACIWDAMNGEIVHILPSEQSSVVAWSPDSQQIAVGGYSVHVWDVNTGEFIKTFAGDSSRITSVAYYPNGTMLASGSKNGTIRIWNYNSGNVVHTLRSDKGSVYAVAWSPDGTQLASVNDKSKITIWDINPEETSVQLVHKTLFNIAARSVAWSPDGTHLASGSSRVVIWDLPAKKDVLLLTPGGVVYSIAWSPNKQQIAAATSKSVIKIWDIDLNLLQLTAKQIDLLEKITLTEKIHEAQVLTPDYQELPSAWKDMLLRAYGAQSSDKGSCVIS